MDFLGLFRQLVHGAEIFDPPPGFALHWPARSKQRFLVEGLVMQAFVIKIVSQFGWHRTLGADPTVLSNCV